MLDCVLKIIPRMIHGTLGAKRKINDHHLENGGWNHSPRPLRKTRQTMRIDTQLINQLTPFIHKIDGCISSCRFIHGRRGVVNKKLCFFKSAPLTSLAITESESKIYQTNDRLTVKGKMNPESTNQPVNDSASQRRTERERQMKEKERKNEM